MDLGEANAEEMSTEELMSSVMAALNREALIDTLTTDVLTVSENGFGKISDVADYRLQARAGKGIKAGVFNAKTGNLVNLKLVAPDEDVMLIADNGVIIRVQASDISKIGRDTLGVRIMKFKDDAKVVCVATTPHEEPAEETAEGEQPAEAEDAE